jgi:hypothetical protein
MKSGVSIVYMSVRRVNVKKMRGTSAEKESRRGFEERERETERQMF